MYDYSVFYFAGLHYQYLGFYFASLHYQYLGFYFASLHYQYLGFYFAGLHYQYLGFYFAGRRPAVAGLLGVLGASMSGPGLHPASHGRCCGMLRSQALSDVYTFGAKRPLPRHLRIGLMVD